MPPIVFELLQWLFLLLLYVFVARAVRAVVRDLRPAGVARAAVTARPAPPRGQARRTRRAEPGQLVVHVPAGKPQVIALHSGDVTFGRDGCDVVLNDPYVSERHARVYREGDEWLLADLGSTNGTFLNQTKVTSPTPVAAGDQFGIGKTTVEVRR